MTSIFLLNTIFRWYKIRLSVCACIYSCIQHKQSWNAFTFFHISFYFFRCYVLRIAKRYPQAPRMFVYRRKEIMRKDKKKSPSSISNHLLERIGVTGIHPIFSKKLSLYYPDMLFNVQTEYSSMRERERERERKREVESLRDYEQRHKEPPRPTSSPNWWLLRLPPTEPQMTFSKFSNFYKPKFRISFVWRYLTKLFWHLTRIPNFPVFFISSVKLVTRHESILLIFGLPV